MSPTEIDAFLRQLEEQDMTVTDWARKNGVPPRSVYALLTGHHTGKWGKARQLAKLMGCTPPAAMQAHAKSEPLVEPPSIQRFLWRGNPAEVLVAKPRYRLHIDGRVDLVSGSAAA